MPYFRKKPVVIEAVQLTQKAIEEHLFDGGNLPDGLKLCAASYNEKDRKVWSFRVGIETLEGFMLADVGDWIIKGVNGEFYPCKPDIFEKTYKPV